MISRRALLSGAATTMGLAVVGCAGTLPPVDPQPIVNILQQVLGFLQTTCRVVADATAVTALISTFPIGTAALVIANAICAVIAVQPPASHRLGHRRGIIINGMTYPTVTLHRVTIPYAHIGTAQAEMMMRSAPMSYVVINGIPVRIGPSPF